MCLMGVGGGGRPPLQLSETVRGINVMNICSKVHEDQEGEKHLKLGSKNYTVNKHKLKNIM